MASDASGRPRKKRRQPAPTAKQAARKGLAGPSTDPATNLLLTDIALRGANVFARLAIEHALLRNRYDATTAKAIIAKRGLGKRVLSLGMSRMPVREALNRLAAEGLITMRPTRGAVTRRLEGKARRSAIKAGRGRVE